MPARIPARTFVAVLTTILLLNTLATGFAKDDKALDVRLAPYPRVLNLIPSDAHAVVVVDNVAQANKRLTKLMERLGKRDGDLLESLKPMAGAGTDDQGSLAVAWMWPKDQGAFVPVFYVPVSDFQAFLKPLVPQDRGEDIWAIQIGFQNVVATEKDDYALITLPGSENLLQDEVTPKTSLMVDVVKFRLWNKTQDVGAIVTPHGIEKFVEMAGAGLDQMKAMFEGNDDPQAQAAAATMAMYKELLATMGSEVTHVGVGSQLDDKGSVRLTARLQFAENGQLAKVHDPQGPDDKLLKGLPGKDFVFAMGANLSQEFVTKMFDFSINFMKSAPQLYGDMTEEQIAELQKTWRKMNNMNGMAMQFSVPAAGEPLLAKTTGVMRVGNAEEFLNNYVKSMEVVAAAIDEQESTAAPKMSVTRVQIGELSAVKIVTEMKLPKNPAANAIQGIFGPNGEMTAFLAKANDKTIVMAYVSEDALQEAVDRASDSVLDNDKLVANTKSLLMKQPQFLAFVSAQGIVQLTEYFIDAVGGQQAREMFQLPLFPERPPLGMAAKQGAEHLDAEIVVPHILLTAIGDYIAQVQAMQAAQFQNR